MDEVGSLIRTIEEVLRNICVSALSVNPLDFEITPDSSVSPSLIFSGLSHANANIDMPFIALQAADITQISALQLHFARNLWTGVCLLRYLTFSNSRSRFEFRILCR